MALQHDFLTRRRILSRLGLLFAGANLTARPNFQAEITERQPATGNEINTGNLPATTKEADEAHQVSLQKIGQIHPSPQSPPSGGYSEAAVRTDGRYAIVGTKWGADGTYLIDLANPAAPERVHYLPGSNGGPNLDVKFDHRSGLYYRAIKRDWPGNFEIIDYGYATGTPTAPTVIGAVDEGKSHNVTPHPTKPVLYTVNYELETEGFDVYDTADPAVPEHRGKYGPEGACHDITVDPARELLCCMYQNGSFTGYIIFDASDPQTPVELGRFDYETRTSYEQADVGEEAFGSCHHGHFDPRRELLVIGDERPYQTPGGKHVFDIGWEEGSLTDPIPIGFTVSPNAHSMEKDKYTDRFDWTGHHFNIVPQEQATMVVSADWHEGVVVYDITDPTAPQSVAQYATDDGAETLEPNDTVRKLGTPPMAWKAAYNATRDLIVVSDVFTGLYTFKLTLVS